MDNQSIQPIMMMHDMTLHDDFGNRMHPHRPTDQKVYQVGR
jgi:hypothetical protein